MKVVKYGLFVDYRISFLSSIPYRLLFSWARKSFNDGWRYVNALIDSSRRGYNIDLLLRTRSRDGGIQFRKLWCLYVIVNVNLCLMLSI
jgi:hypothetical protein